MKVGDTVTCIQKSYKAILDKLSPRDAKRLRTPREGKDYTITEVRETDLGPVLQLEECYNQPITHPASGNKVPVYFSATCFKIKENEETETKNPA